jgi:hypothetical protein
MTSKQMTTQEIVKNSTEVKENKLDWKQVYVALHQSIASNKYRVFSQGNTLFWIRIDEPGVAQMYVFNADSYKNLFRSMKDFATAMHKAGYKKVYGETADINILNLIKRIGFPVDVAPLGKDSKGRQLYRGTVNV